MHASRQERGGVLMTQVMQPRPFQSEFAGEPVEVPRDRVRGDWTAITVVDHEVEVGLRHPEQEPASALVDPVTTEERDGRGRYADRSSPSVRLRV